MPKIILNGQIYSNSSMLYYKELSGVLLAGETSITISDSVITSSSTIDITPDIITAKPTSVTISNGSIVLTFDEQDEDVNIKVKVC